MEEIQPKGGGPSFPFGCERKEEKESDSASGTLGGPRIREGRWKKAVSAPEFRQTTSGTHGSANRADCLPRGKPPACIDRRQLCRKKFPLAGPDAPTPARIGTGRPKGRSHFSFGGERKVCKRKPAARRLQRRPAPLRTAAKSCATLVLGYALHGLRPFLALVGLRPPLVAGFVLR